MASPSAILTRDFGTLNYPSDLELQTRSARVLSALDAKIDLNNRINAELEALAKTIYDYWFVQFDFPDAHGRPYKSSGGAMVWNDTLKREIPAGWKRDHWTTSGKSSAGARQSTTEAANFSPADIPWITPKDLSNNKGNKFIHEAKPTFPRRVMRAASLTASSGHGANESSRAPVGYLAIALNPVTTNQGFKSFVPLQGSYGTSFVYHAR